MWRTPEERADSARERLALAAEWWGWEPHGRQREFFSATAQVRVAACGRRWGKTEALAVDIASLALAEARAGRGCRQLVVAPTESQALLVGAEVSRRLWEALGGEGEACGLRLHLHRSHGLRAVVAPAGVDPRRLEDKKPGDPGPAPAWVFFRSAGRDGRSLRGLWAHRILVDEAGFVPDDVVTDVLLPMLTDVGGELTLASSPAGRRNIFYRLWARGVAGADGDGADGLGVASFQCPSSDNPHLDKAFLGAMREELGAAGYAAEYEAQFVDEAGAVFREEDIAAALAEDARVRLVAGSLVAEPEPGRRYSVGVDWARRRDFTVICVLDVTDRPARVVGLHRWQGVGWDALAARVAEVAARFGPGTVLTDGTGLGDVLVDGLQAALRARVPDGERVPPVTRYVFTADSKARLVDTLTVALSSRSVTFPHHTALLRELRGFAYGPEGASGRPTMAARGGGHDDCVIALALALYAAPVAAAPPPGSRMMLGSQAGLAVREWADVSASGFCG